MTQPLTSTEKLRNISKQYKEVSELRDDAVRYIRQIEEAFAALQAKHNAAIQQALLVVSGADTLLEGYVSDFRAAFNAAQKETTQSEQPHDE